MKQTLGKLFLILFLNISALANVEVSVSSPIVYDGEAVNFIISADGEDISFPNIDNIAGYPIIGTSSSESINMINMKITQTTSKTYSFRPTKSLTIPSYSLMVDGINHKTKELTVTMGKPTASKNGSDFVLEMKINSQEAYVGEALNLSILFKQKHGITAGKVQLSELKVANFWVKKTKNVQHSQEGLYSIQTLNYQLFPQKSGKFILPAMEALVGVVDNTQDPFNNPFFGRQLSWKKIYSNDINLTVHALPNGLELYGNYSISASVDKQKVQANKPVNLNIQIEGEGNIDDIKKFNLNINNTIVYADEPKVSSNIGTNNFSQKIAIIADQNFTVPSLSLKYFDKKTKEVKEIKTKPIPIHVMGGNTKSNKTSSIEVSPSNIINAPQAMKVKTKTVTIIKQEDAYIKYLFLFAGFILGLGLAYIYHHLNIKKKKIENNMIKAIKKAKSDKVLFDVLLPYSKESTVVSNALNQLEENLYKSTSHKIDKELLMEFFEER